LTFAKPLARLCPVFKAILLLTKGIIRDQTMRRKMMFWVMLAAIVMFAAGWAFITDQWIRQNPWFTMGYYLVCAWLLLAAMLLALMDILVLRAIHRAARRKIEREILKKDTEPEE
jgi:hypothetical protein